MKESLLRKSENNSNLGLSSGKNYLIGSLRQVGMDNPSSLPSGSVIMDKHNSHNLQYGYISSDVPIVRYDTSGNVLPSDLELIDKSIMQRILARRTKRLA
jgi:hypothetical protein